LNLAEQTHFWVWQDLPASLDAAGVNHSQKCSVDG
jgi:hypothetical protein